MGDRLRVCLKNRFVTDNSGHLSLLPIQYKVLYNGLFTYLRTYLLVLMIQEKQSVWCVCVWTITFELNGL